MSDLPLWPHQERAIQTCVERLEAGAKRIALTSPTGGGKTRMATELIYWALENDKRVALYTNRRILFEQLMRVLSQAGVEYGCMAAGCGDLRSPGRPVQLCMTPSVHSRTRSFKWKLHPAHYLLVDELHLQKQDTMQKILREHYEQHDSSLVGLTATPLGVSHLCDELIVAGNNSQLRDCGALLPCDVFGPSELDTRNIKRTATGEYNYRDIVKKVWTTKIFGYVYESWMQLNPDARLTLLFAPGVAESLWFAKQFEQQGVRAAHVDGDSIYLDGQEYETDRDGREEILRQAKEGQIQVICNRFVLREGVDLPEVYNVILACPIGSLVSYIQTVGRLLRNHPSMDRVLLTDHGGNYVRHGDPNSDWDWERWWTEPVRMPTDARIDAFRESKAKEPICCPQCYYMRESGSSCPQCGYRYEKRVRRVIQINGSLVPLTGAVYPPRNRRETPSTRKLWESMYYRALKADMSFRQAEALFYVERCKEAFARNRGKPKYQWVYGYWPPRNLPLMPKDDFDWLRPVRQVEKSKLL